MRCLKHLKKIKTLNRKEIISQIFQKKSCLCVGLDTDLEKIPDHFEKKPTSIFAFNKEIIDATKDLCVSYKINTAFYEAYGAEGWKALEQTINYIPSTHFKIADAKRGDIGNTSSQYAKAFFENLPFDAITIAPYMGQDSIAPFLKFKNKWSIILALTSNEGTADFQQQLCGQKPLWQSVLEKTSQYGSDENTMYVVGATKANDLKSVREIVPNHFLLIPGVGAQGGSVREVMENGKNADCGLLINVSRGIIFAGKDRDFAQAAQNAAASFQTEMKDYL